MARRELNGNPLNSGGQLKSFNSQHKLLLPMLSS
jgi:hypothetical protein